MVVASSGRQNFDLLMDLPRNIGGHDKVAQLDISRSTAHPSAETTETVTEFFSGLFPNIVRSEAFTGPGIGQALL
jgi:hypothetical protein